MDEIIIEENDNGISIDLKINENEIVPELENLEITPSMLEQHFKSKKDGYSSVTVNGDSNLKPENIKEGVSIFGVEGTGGSIPIVQEGTLIFNGTELVEKEVLVL